MMAPQNMLIEYDMYSGENYVKQDLSYLADKSDWLGNKTPLRRSLGLVQQNEIKNLITTAYENSAPSIVSDGENMVMAFLDADTSRGNNNATVVKYSVYDKTTRQWSSPVILDTNNTGDYSPLLYLIGDDIYLTYMDSSQEYEDDEPSDLPGEEAAAIEKLLDDAKSLNLCMAKFNRETGMFDAVDTIAEAGNMIRSAAAMGTVGSHPVAAWIENPDAADIFRQNDKNEIWYRTYENGVWSDAVNMVYGAKCVTDIAVVQQGIAYVSDSDMNLNTDGDKILYLGDEILDTGSISSLRVCEDTLMWTNSGILKKYDGESVSEIFDDITLASDFVIKDNSLYYIAAEKNSSNIYRRIYDSAADIWSEPVKLTGSDRYIEYMSVAELDGSIYASFTNTAVGISETDIERKCDLAWCRLDEVTDITVEDAEYDSSCVKPEAQVPVKVTVLNSGNRAVDSLYVTVTDKAGNIVYEDSLNMEIAAGQQREIEIPLVMGESISPETYTINIDTDGDRNPDDNSIETVIGYTDFELTCEQVQAGNTGMIYMTVKNNSHTPSSGIIYISDENACTYSADIPELAYGESCTSVVNLSKVHLTEGNSGQIRIEAVADVEEQDTYDNYELLYLETYRITYLAFAGDESPFMVQDKKYDDYTKITEEQPTKQGYRFAGWSTDNDAKEPEYQEGERITANRDLTLYGVWYLLGDVDGDDRLGIGDSVILKRYIAGWEGYENLLNKEAADINGDGKIDFEDLTLLERHIAGWKGYEQLEYGMKIPE